MRQFRRLGDRVLSFSSYFDPFLFDEILCECIFSKQIGSKGQYNHPLLITDRYVVNITVHIEVVNDVVQATFTIKKNKNKE